jgi:hypothetical protein
MRAGAASAPCDEETSPMKSIVLTLATALPLLGFAGSAEAWGYNDGYYGGGPYYGQQGFSQTGQAYRPYAPRRYGFQQEYGGYYDSHPACREKKMRVYVPDSENNFAAYRYKKKKVTVCE